MYPVFLRDLNEKSMRYIRFSDDIKKISISKLIIMKRYIRYKRMNKAYREGIVRYFLRLHYKRADLSS